MHPSMFYCPDCEYQCSPSALSCLNCGHIFRVSQYVDTRPQTNPVIRVIAFLVVSFAVVLTIGLILNASRKTVELGTIENDLESLTNQTVVEARRKFALNMQAITLENSNTRATDLIYTTEDYLEKSDALVATSSTLIKKDCDLLANKDYGQAAASLGFNRVTCRNSRLRSEWSLMLEKAKF